MEIEPERTMATFWIPPRFFKLFFALGPKNTSRKFDPWLSSRDWRKLEVSSTGGLRAAKVQHLMESLSYASLTVLGKLTDTGDFIYECCVVTICNIYGGVWSWSLVNKCGAVWRRVKCGATRCFYCEVVVRSNLSSRHLSIGGGCRWLVHKEN